MIKSTKLKSILCDYSDGYVLVKECIPNAGRATYRENKQAIFKT